MRQSRRHRRPHIDADAEEQRLYRQRIAAGLEAMGVGYGREFVTMPLADFEALVDGSKARGSDPDTSKLAALQNEPRRGSQRHRIVTLLVAERKGLTASDIAERMDIPLNSISTRMSECERGGWVRVYGTVDQDGSARSLYSPTTKALEAYGPPR